MGTEFGCEPDNPDRYKFSKLVDQHAKILDPETGWKENIGNRTKRNIKETLQARFLSFLASGASVQVALDAIGRQQSTLNLWRKEEKFREEFIRAQTIVHQFSDKTSNEEFVKIRKDYFGFDTWGVHNTIIDRFSRVGDDKEDSGFHMVLVPPLSGKTTLTADYVCYRIAKNPNIRILIVSQTQKLADKMSDRIRARLYPGEQASEKRARFANAFGPFYVKGQERTGKPWRADAFRVAGCDHDEMNYTVEAKGWDCQMYGDRYDLIILDDLQSLKNLEATDDIMEVIQQEVITRPDEAGNIVWVSTRVGRNDVASRLIKEGVVPPECVTEIPALDREGNPTLPERWTVEKLARRRVKVGEQVWNTAYMMAPDAGDSQTFRDADINRACNKNFSIKPLPKEEYNHLLSLDPALGGWNSLTAVAYNDKEYVVLNQQNTVDMPNNEAIIGQIATYAARYNPQQLVIETNSLNRGIGRDKRLQDVASQFGFVIVPHETSGANKKDPLIGVSGMASGFIRGDIVLADEDPQVLYRLRQELANWRPEKKTKHLIQDTVMSLWFGWTWWMDHHSSVFQELSAWDGEGLPWDSFEDSYASIYDLSDYRSLTA